jgi:ribosomal protein S18 acetylase RimI-like enzyme
MDRVMIRAVAPNEVEEFLDWFERYWEELETFSDFPDPFARSEYRRLLQEPGDQHFWWADVDGRHAGFCVFTIGHHWYRRDVIDGYVDEFYVEPALRRGGVGRTLANAMLAEFRRRGVRRMELSVLPRNTRARAFWASLGFELALLRMAWAGEAAVPTKIKDT